jgi:hypothetical protein
MSTARSLGPKTVTLTFSKNFFDVTGYPYKGATVFTLSMVRGGRHLDWEVASAAQVFRMLGTVFPAVENLTFEYASDRFSISSEWNNEADRTQRRKLLG